MNSVSPVYTEEEVHAEQVIALEQPEYYPIIVCRIKWTEDGKTKVATATRYRFTQKEREAIANGADLILTQPHHGDLMPLGTQLAMPDEYPLEGL